MKTDKDLKSKCKIAVIGISCKYPGANSPVELWENILARRRQFREMPDVRLPNKDYYDPDPNVPNKTYQNKAAVIDGFEFDWAGHKIPKQTFESTDIVHWLALDTALKAVADTHYNKETLPREKTGVILGNTLTGEFTRSNQMLLRWPYVKRALIASARSRGMEMIIDDLAGTMEEYYKSVFAEVTEDTLAGGLANTIAGRVCNFLDLHGGGYIVDGACSSSLIAVVTACNMLELEQLDMVIAGGVDVSLDTFELIGFAKTGALTPDEMRVYDKNGRGFLPGEGCGMVILKRYEDAVRDKDNIYATIEGWGISSDGKGGITAPSVAGQSRALIRAYEKAQINPSRLDFIEGHGTGTTVGDRVELEAISNALDHFGDTKGRTCGVTSFKSIVGHTKAAAGIGAFIKTIIAVNRRIIPPTAGLKELNPVFYDKAKNIFPVLNGEIRDPDSRMLAGVSAMGFGGINSHVVVASAGAPSDKMQSQMDEKKLLTSSGTHMLFLFAGHSVDELTGKIEKCIQDAAGISYAELNDLSAEINSITDHSAKFRVAVIAATPFELSARLNKALGLIKNHGCQAYITEENDSIAIGYKRDSFKIGAVFPGQGSQKLNMAIRIAQRHQSHQSLLQKAETILKLHGAGKVKDAVIRELNKATDPQQVKEWMNELKNTDIAQPAITLASLLWYEYLRQLGVEISCVTGHSLGELMSFYAAGMMDMETLLEFAVFRGKSMAERGSGKMVSVQCNLDEAKALISKAGGYSTIANINGPGQIVISGEATTIDQIVNLAKKDNKNAILLPVSAAFHSNLVSETAVDVTTFSSFNKKAVKNSIEIISCMDGTSVSDDMNLNEYFSRQVTGQVNFVEAVNSMAKVCDVVIEAGPGRVLSGLIPSINEKLKAFPVELSGDDDQSLLILLGNLFVNGTAVKTDLLYENQLIRKFIPASKRRFIVNPLEREFTFTGNIETGNLFMEGISKEDHFRNYLAERRDFIREVIHTDYKYYKNNLTTISVADGKSVVNRAPLGVTNVKNASAPDIKEKNTSIQTVLFEALQAMTGFLPESFSGNMKLLDDFNLDSIKSATLLSKIAKKLNITGKLNIQQLSNSSIDEIIRAIESNLDHSFAKETQDTASIYEQIRKEVYEQLAIKTGFPSESLKPDLRLLDDLNLDSIKSGSIIAGLAKKFDVTGKISTAALSNAKITEVIDAITVQIKGLIPAKSSVINTNNHDWVNAYTRVVVKKPTDTEDTVSLPEQLIIVHGKEDHKMAENIDLGLKSRFKETIITGVETLKESGSGSCLIALLPVLEINMSNTEKIISYLIQLNQASLHAAVVVFIEQSGNDGVFSISSYAASLHLERPEIKYRVIRLENGIPHEALPDLIANEIRTGKFFESVFYNNQMERFEEQYKLVDHKENVSSGIRLSGTDVVLATGGAKGITARCVLEMARKYRHKTALVGSSPLNDEIKSLLETYRKEDLAVTYFPCDITDPASVKEMTASIRASLGEVTVVVHGAGKNVPRRAEAVSFNEAISEISPKLKGALALSEALRNTPVRTFIALTSIIGITGMKGNSLYAFANENLDRFLRKDSNSFKYRARTYAYSIWDEIGMGARMGSNEVLSAIGIGSINPMKGVEQFLKWIESEAGDQQVVISSAMGMLDTWKVYMNNFPLANRYIGEVQIFEPGRNITTRVRLNANDDPYLKDHNFNDTLLFPTVFGLEAMTQVSCALLGVTDPAKIVFENLMLSQPIIVPPEGETVVQIDAQLIHEIPDEKRIRAGIKVEYTNFSEYHFSSEIVLSLDHEVIHMPQIISSDPLNICPETDLYSWLLFQGPKFRQIKNVYGLTAGDVSFTTHPYRMNGQRMVLGSAYLRDVLLQSVQIFLTGKKYLPVSVKKWTIFRAENHLSEGFVNSRLTQMKTDSALCDVEFVVNSQLAEKIEGYEVKAVALTPGHPVPEIIADLPSAYMKIMRNEFARYSGFCKQPVFFEIRKHHEVFNRLNAAQRFEVEQKAFEALTSGLADPAFKNARIIRGDNGKPFVEGANLDISISHTGTLLLITAGCYKQGCDIELITNRSKDEWNDLLENRYSEVLSELLTVDGDLNTAATRLWCAREALIKSNGIVPLAMSIERVEERGIIMKVGSRDQGIHWVLTFPATVLPNNCIMTAMLIDYDKNAVDTARAIEMNSAYDESEKCFVHSFISTFKDCRGFYGKSHFAVIPEWMGSLRELVLAPISNALLKDLASGEYGMVTNNSDIRILNETDSLCEITGKLRITENSDLDNSLIDLSFDFYKNNSKGRPLKLAECRLSTTWVAIEGRGEVKKSPLPGYFRNFLSRHIGKTSDHSSQITNNGYPLIHDLGRIVFEEKNPVSHNVLLYERDFITGMYDGNSVGNLYYSNYYRWQAEIIEQYFYNIIPGILKANGRKGEFITVESTVRHLQEAMPFERIHVNMYLDKIYENGFKMKFAYFSNDEKAKRKLAHGDNTIIFCKRFNSESLPVACAIPEIAFNQVLNHTQA